MKQVFYTSWRHDDTAGTGYSPDFAAIVDTARKRNKTLAITGFLVCAPSWYCQVLEGPDRHINALIARITADSRHFDVTVVESNHIEVPSFPDWGMAWKHQNIETRIHFLELGLVGNLKPEASQLPQLKELIRRLASPFQGEAAA